MTQLVSYSNQPGNFGQSVPDGLPSDLQDTESGEASDQATVLVFYHPHCPCTRATVRCMERMVASFASKPRIIAYAYVPSHESDGWIASKTTDKMRRLGDVTVIADRNAEACRRFDVATSGHVLVYNANAELNFSGGITPSRGHEGNGPTTAAPSDDGSQPSCGDRER